MSGFSAADAAIINERAGARCEIDGGTDGLQTHHRNPRRMGGRHGDAGRRINAIPNGLRLCHRCHADAESNRERAMQLGWVLAEGEDPAERQVWLRPWCGPGWYWLDHAGGYLFAPPPENT